LTGQIIVPDARAALEPSPSLSAVMRSGPPANRKARKNDVCGNRSSLRCSYSDSSWQVVPARRYCGGSGGVLSSMNAGVCSRHAAVSSRVSLVLVSLPPTMTVILPVVGSTSTRSQPAALAARTARASSRSRKRLGVRGVDFLRLDMCHYRINSAPRNSKELRRIPAPPIYANDCPPHAVSYSTPSYLPFRIILVNKIIQRPLSLPVKNRTDKRVKRSPAGLQIGVKANEAPGGHSYAFGCQ